MKYVLHQGSNEQACAMYPENHFDGVMCDSPYGNRFMGKKWDYDVPSIDEWAGILHVSKPGAALINFGSPKTYHRMAVNVEDAGWIPRDQLMWLYASAMPKSLNLGKHVPGWDGYGTNLKPCYEPALLAMKPLDGTFAENAAKWGAGGLSIDENRIGGRFPTNMILDEEAGAMLDEEAGERKSGKSVTRNGGGGKIFNGNGGYKEGSRDGGYTDSGGASRFFFSAKVNAKEREAGCENLAHTSPSEVTSRKEDSAGLSDGRAGAGRTSGYRNTHPTMKPISLCTRFASLILPPPRADGSPRRLLVPFAGSGSEMIGALLAGWDEVVGIEIDEHYADIARARLKHWVDNKGTK